MLDFLLKIYLFFSPYVNLQERKVDKFLKWVNANRDQKKVQKRLLGLMKEDLIVLNLWIEKKFKNYSTYTKRARRRMYEDRDLMVLDFKKFLKKTIINSDDLPVKSDKKIELIENIKLYLTPGRIFKYRESSSFSKLLKDPNKETLIGDCNQIVTLYVYLYGLKRNIKDLNIKILKDHVCLHYNGADIEATIGQYKNYDKHLGVLPIYELISTNILDISDPEERVKEIKPKVFIKSASLAYLISSMKDVVSRNLEVAYHNLGIAAAKKNNFKKAIFYLEKKEDKTSLKNILRNAAIYELKKNNFSKALKYAKKLADPVLQEDIRQNQGVFHFKRKEYSKALRIFKNIGRDDLAKKVYLAQYNALAKRVKAVKTVKDAKRFKPTYRKMLALAYRIEDNKRVQSIKKILKQI